MAKNLTLAIGNKNFSSWSLRPWIVLKYFQIPFKEHLIPLNRKDSKKKLRAFSEAGKVPVLKHGKTLIWDSLAICEYLAEQFPQYKMWPSQPAERAWARSISCEMHSGFMPMRSALGMNLNGRDLDFQRTSTVKSDIKRILTIWEECRKRFVKKGDFLFGPFTIADAMFLPVATRFKTYGIKLNNLAAAYQNTLLSLPSFQAWEAEAT